MTASARVNHHVPMNANIRQIHRFRGCFIGGPLDGHELPAHVEAGGVAVCRCEVPGSPGLVEVRYLHRRASVPVGDSLHDVEFLVYDQLTDEQAAQLVDQHRDRRGGWGDPILTLPASGFWYRPELQLSREFDDAGVMSERVHTGVVTRLSPAGACIAQHMADTSRALSREEVDATRCGWCMSGIGHTIDEHRHRLEMTAAAERAAEFEGPELDELPSASLPLAVAHVLHGPQDPELAIGQASRAMLEAVLSRARDTFIARREAESRPRLVLP